MATETRERLLQLGADPALATFVSGETEDGYAYRGARDVLLGINGATVESADMTAATPVTDKPESGKVLVITYAEISIDAACTVSLLEETTNRLVGKYFLPAPSVLILKEDKVLLKVGARLQVQTSNAVNIAVTAKYYSIEEESAYIVTSDNDLRVTTDGDFRRAAE
jgi:hypothetical protein